jgi:hypothetical protein
VRVFAEGVMPWHDFPSIGLTIPTFSRRAVDALGDMLKEAGELLPLKTDVGEYYAFNCRAFAPRECLDLERSEINWGLDYKYISSVRRYEFEESMIEGLPVFRLPLHESEVAVTEGFVERAIEAGLHGFSFERLWPLPEQVRWTHLYYYHHEWRQAKARRRRRARRGRVALEPPLDPIDARTDQSLGRFMKEVEAGTMDWNRFRGLVHG